jgi:predicted DNA-binding transcriptional regulator AlpA
MANDQHGDIFIESSVGLFQFDGKKYWLIDPAYNKGALIFYKGKLSNFKAIKDKVDFIEMGEKNQVWLPFLPLTSSNFIYHAKGKNGRQFIARDNLIHELTIKNKFKIIQKGNSTRGISIIGKDLYVNTYSGIFKNENRILPDIGNGEGMLHDSQINAMYFTSDKDIIRLALDSNKTENKNYLKEIGGQHYITCIIKFKNKIYLGTSKGLAQLEPFAFLSKEFLIHYFSIIEDVLYLATNEGSYQFDGKNIEKCTFLPNENTNGISKIGINFWASTKKGLWVYNTENKKLENKILNSELPSLECNAIQKDNNGFYWVSTSSGLYRFGNENEKTEVFFPEIEFNKRSYLAHNGIFYFGSVNGVFSFDPLDFPDLVISNGFIVDNLNIIGFFLLVIIGLLIYLLIKRKQTFILNKESNVSVDEKLDYSDKDKFLFDLGAFILQNLSTITVDELIEYSGMNKKAFYKYIDENYKALPSFIINSIKILKARSLLKENPGITMESLTKFTGYSTSHLYSILKQEDEKLPKELSILYDLKY